MVKSSRENFLYVVPSSEETSLNHFLLSVFQSSYYTVTCYKFMMDICVQLPCTAIKGACVQHASCPYEPSKITIVMNRWKHPQ